MTQYDRLANKYVGIRCERCNEPPGLRYIGTQQFMLLYDFLFTSVISQMLLRRILTPLKVFGRARMTQRNP